MKRKTGTQKYQDNRKCKRGFFQKESQEVRYTLVDLWAQEGRVRLVWVLSTFSLGALFTCQKVVKKFSFFSLLVCETINQMSPVE